MLLENPSTDLRLARLYVDVLDAFNGRDPQFSMDALLRPFYGLNFASGFIPPGVASLPYYYVLDPERTLVFIDGVKTSAQASALMNGYSLTNAPPDLASDNTWLRDQATAILARLNLGQFVLPANVDVIGYSAGGAVAVYLKAQLLSTFPVVRSKCITFGSPRSGGSSLQTALSRSPVTRWMVDADPIPLVPLRLEDSPGLMAIQPVPTLLRWATFLHVAGGLSLDVQGNVTASTLPPLAQAGAIAAMAAWFLSEENDPHNPHSLGAYRAYLNTAISRSPLPSDSQPRPAPAEVLIPTSRAMVNRRQTENVRAIATAGDVQNAAPQIIPEAVLFRAVRLGHIWCVEFGGEIVCQCPIKKRARHIARAGNDFLRSLPKQALVDPATLIERFQTFLQLSADPTSGFNPTINTTIN